MFLGGLAVCIVLGLMIKGCSWEGVGCGCLGFFLIFAALVFLVAVGVG